MSTIGSDRMDPKRELFNLGVDEVDGVLLSVTPIDLERTDAGGVIDGRILEAADRPAVFSFESQEL